MIVATLPRPLRVLVVDDSPASQDALVRILRGGGLEVVGTASDGEEGLVAALRLGPDLVLLDLEMPRVDGFTFLRLLTARRPVPVIVISSRSHKSDAFKALELGAIDFLVKPDGGPAAFEGLRDELLARCRVLGALRPFAAAGVPPPAPAGAAPGFVEEPTRVAVIGASTGGPQALTRLLAALPRDLPLALVVALHMPAQFTAAFAERLGRRTLFSAREASDGDLIAAGRVLVAPGGRDVELRRDARGPLRVAVLPPDPSRGHFVPSVDRLFLSAAAVLGPRTCAVVLTGMGDDGGEGAAAVKRAGGLTLAEAEESALVYGMPKAAVDRGVVDELLPLRDLAARLATFARAR